MQAVAKIKDIRTGEIRLCETKIRETNGLPDPYIWSDGNYACDCNMYLFFERAIGNEPDDDECSCLTDFYQVELFVGEELIYSDYSETELANMLVNTIGIILIVLLLLLLPPMITVVQLLILTR